MDSAIKLSNGKIANAETAIRIDNTGTATKTLDNNEPRKMKSKIDITISYKTNITFIIVSC